MSSACSRRRAVAAALCAVALLPTAGCGHESERPVAVDLGYLDPAAAPPPIPGPDPAVLRVCADPNNLPFSNQAREGFENRLAELLAAHLGRHVEYTWWPQRRGFVRHTLNLRTCDLVMGVPADYDLTLTTHPYYTSTYVFVTRAAERPVRTLDDPALHRLRIGVHVIGDDYANVPPAQALADRGIVANVRGFSIYGNYAEPNPPERLIAAVADRQIDVAIAWGPLGGYYAAREDTPLRVTPVPAAPAGSPLRYTFAIAMGVRRDEGSLRDAINRFLDERGNDVRHVLHEFGVPLADGKV